MGQLDDILASLHGQDDTMPAIPSGGVQTVSDEESEEDAKADADLISCTSTVAAAKHAAQGKSKTGGGSKARYKYNIESILYRLDSSPSTSARIEPST